MEVTTTEFKRCDLVKVVGRVDSQTAPQLEETFAAIIGAGRFRIVFDASDVSFMSSAGLRVLIDTQKTCKRWNRGEVVLASPSDQMRQTLDLAGFLPLFKIYPTAVEAVGSF